MAQHNDLGRWGEQIAADYLTQRGWYIRHRDWRNVHKDLDIIAIDEDMSILLIVEVKTRSSMIYGEPDEAIDLVKKENIISATRTYVRDYKLEHLPVRYDTISVIGQPDGFATSGQHTAVHIEHKENAFGVIDNYMFHEENRKRMRRKKHPGCWS